MGGAPPRTPERKGKKAAATRLMNNRRAAQELPKLNRDSNGWLVPSRTTPDDQSSTDRGGGLGGVGVGDGDAGAEEEADDTEGHAALDAQTR